MFMCLQDLRLQIQEKTQEDDVVGSKGEKLK